MNDAVDERFVKLIQSECDLRSCDAEELEWSKLQRRSLACEEEQEGLRLLNGSENSGVSCRGQYEGMRCGVAEYGGLESEMILLSAPGKLQAEMWRGAQY